MILNYVQRLFLEIPFGLAIYKFDVFFDLLFMHVVGVAGLLFVSTPIMLGVVNLLDESFVYVTPVTNCHLCCVTGFSTIPLSTNDVLLLLLFCYRWRSLL